MKKEANVLKGSLCTYPLRVCSGDSMAKPAALSICLQPLCPRGALRGQLGLESVFSKVTGGHCVVSVPTRALGVFPEEQGGAEWQATTPLPPPHCPPLASAVVGLGTGTQTASGLKPGGHQVPASFLALSLHFSLCLSPSEDRDAGGMIPS